ncbi:AMP-binding protein [Paenibacillus koleovorans]|uniref:AMP-binding protein n=1 Tax=Paenibacillus koleovorans TaxID=121608 RepID=UPI000FDA397E|nr:AMP-binding protein [Paenibacillus koleovorans]
MEKALALLFRLMLEPFLKRVLRHLFRLKVEGIERIDRSKPFLVMPNHVSLWEAILLGMVLPKEVHFVVNTHIARRFHWIVSQRNHITVDPRNPLSVRKMVQTVKSGKPLVIFPEGRITVTGGLMKIYDGSGYIALKTGVPVYPVAINGLERSKLSYINHLHKTTWFPRVSLHVGEPFTVKVNDRLPMKEKKREASYMILRKLQDLIVQSRLEQDVNLFNRLLLAAKSNGSKTVVAEDLNGKLTYKQLVLGSHVLGNALHKSIPDQERVAIFLPNANGLLVTLFSLFKIGKTPAMLNFSAGLPTLLDAIQTAGTRTLLTSRLFVEKGKFHQLMQSLNEHATILYLEDLRASIAVLDKIKGLIAYKYNRQTATASHSELVLFTSGSESKPKGVVLTHANLFANIQQVRAMIDFTQRDYFFNALPMFHSFGLTVGTLLPVLTGAKVFLYPSPLHYKEIPEMSYEKKVTAIFGTSTFLSHYGKHAHPYDFFNVRYAAAGAEKLREEVRELWQNKFGIRIIEGYGITETSPVLALNSPLMYRKGTVGQFVPGIRWKVEPVEGIERGGNLLVQGPNVMKGYLIHRKGFVPAEAWYDTGDIVDVSPDGYVTIQARRKMFAKIAGEMVSLIDVEQLAEQCFGNAQFAAIQLPDARKGEKIVLVTSNKGIQKEKLREFLSLNGHSSLKLPSDLVEIDAIPLLGSGKMNYPAIRNMVQEQSL